MVTSISTNITSKSFGFKFSTSNTLSNDASQYIRVKSSGASLFLKISDIIMVEAESNYSNIYLQSGKKIMTSKTLKYWQNILSNNIKMIRVHQSYLINLSAIFSFNAISKTVTLTNGKEVVCSRRLIRPIQNIFSSI